VPHEKKRSYGGDPGWIKFTGSMILLSCFDTAMDQLPSQAILSPVEATHLRTTRYALPGADESFATNGTCVGRASLLLDDLRSS